MQAIAEQMRRLMSRVLPEGMRERMTVLSVGAALFPAVGVVVFAFNAAPVPLALLWSALFIVPGALCLYGAVTTAGVIAGFATRIARAADDTLGLSGADRYQRIQSNLDLIDAKVDTNPAGAARDPITHMPVRDEFLAGVTADIAHARGESLLGLVRLANYERVAAFDGAGAKRILTAFAGRLRDAVHPSRRVGHVDRDCFAIWFNGADRKKAAAELRALSYVLAQEITAPGVTLAPDVQIGFAIHPIDADDAASLINRAFVSLARPQRTSEGRIAFFAPPSTDEARRNFALEQDLRQAVRRNELALHYQPSVDVLTGKIHGAEALLRWNHSALGAIGPSEFVALLEESGLVHEIGLWTLTTACRQLAAWRGTPLGDIKLAINLSAHQFHDPALKSALQRTLSAHNLEPQQLELELTETVAMADAEHAVQVFEELKRMGFSLAIDDFGAGYSSLSYLKRLPFNKLKIDREFVTRVDQLADSRAICRALIELSAGLGISVLAEGVERAEEVEVLRKLGCTTFQGYYFSPPLSAEALADRVAKGEWLNHISHLRGQGDLRRRTS